MNRALRVGVYSLALASFGIARLQAAPRIDSITPRSLVRGATNVVSVQGADLRSNGRLLLSVPTSSQKQLPGNTATASQWEVSLPADASVGVATLRVADELGISNELLVGIDDLPVVPPGPSIPKIPSSATVSIAGPSVFQTNFVGKKGEHIVVDVEARRLGSSLDPVVELLHPNRVPLVWSQGKPPLSGDARVEAVLPADGQYVIEVHDALYNAPAGSFFRLKVGDLKYVDMTYPLGGKEGQKTSIEWIGHLPPTRAVVAPTGAFSDAPAPLPLLPGMTGSAPRFLVDELPQVLEGARDKFKLPIVQAPAAIHGRLDIAGEDDKYRLLVQPGAAFRFDLTAERAGSSLDGVLTIRDENGKELAVGDDRPGTKDPGLDFTVPAGVGAVVVSVADLHNRGGSTFPYRLTVQPVGKPDFTLSLFEDRRNLSMGSATTLRVRADRAGYNGPIQLVVLNLPDGISVAAGDVIPAGANETLLSLVGFGVRPSHQVVSILGIGVESNPPLRRLAMKPSSIGSQRQPWLRTELGLSLSTQPPALSVAWDDSDDALPLGYQRTTLVRVSRAADAAGPIRLSLISTQIPPKKPDGKDDVERAIRLAGNPTLSADQSAVPVEILVPGDLAPMPYDLAMQAELLSPDGKTVIAQATSISRRLRPTTPFTLELASNAAVEARAGTGPAGEVVGRIHRTRGFSHPVSLTLTGLPAEVLPPETALSTDAQDFRFPVTFPFLTPTGPLAKVRLVGLSRMAAGRVARSNEIPLTVTVAKGASPPLLTIFEDSPQFVDLLTEGDGASSLESADRVSGGASIRIGKVQRFRTKLPGLGCMIAEKPGEGEYRYLRFAWKKKGGSNILLQLGVNDGFGPTKGTAGPGYRYEAGPGDNPYNASAVRLDAKLPEQWTIVTRDLFADFGTFKLTGIALTPGEGDYGLFDHLYLARSLEDFKGCPPTTPPSQPIAGTK